MTAYNREKFIGAAIESALAQTFPDWELVVVDDCSRDKTVEVAEAYAARDHRIRVHVNEKNLGDYPNRNRAARLARGRFLKYLDSDDLMYPHCLEVMHGQLASEPRAAFALSGSKPWSGGPCPLLLSPRQAFQKEWLGGGGLFSLGPGCALLRTATFHELGGFPSEYGVASDYMFWLRACARVPVLLLPADLYWYRIHPGQELSARSAPMQYASLGAQMWDFLHSIDCPLQGLELEQARRNVSWYLTRAAVWELRAGRWQCARMYLAGMSLWEWLRYCRRARVDPNAGMPRDANGECPLPSWLVSNARRGKEGHDAVRSEN
jgi:glycosyltransferase involved in cell wall biosynthesis